jgi:hypothetical protein
LTDLERLAEDVMLHRVRRNYQAVAEGTPARALLKTTSVSELVLNGRLSAGGAPWPVR